MKSVFAGAWLLFIFAGAHAQNQVGKNIEDHLLIKSANKDIHGEGEAETIGSPYLNEKFVPGTVYTFNATFVELPMRYDIYKDYVEFQQKNQTYILDPELRVKKVMFDNKTFVVVKYDYKGKSQLGYLQLLDSGKVMLLAKKMVLYREAQAPKALESSATPAKYSSIPDLYFYKFADGGVVRIESVKQIIENFPEQKEALAAYIKQEKISVKKEQDLIKLIKHYNSF